MNHLSAWISNPNRNRPLDDSIYIHFTAKRHPYREAQDRHATCLIVAGVSGFTSRDNRKYHEETRSRWPKDLAQGSVLKTDRRMNSRN